MNTKMQRTKTGRPAPGHLEIDAWIRAQENRLGIASGNSEAKRSTVTVMLPSMAAVTRLAHAAADAKIAADPEYDSMCERLDAELAEILEGVSKNWTPLRRSNNAENSAKSRRVLRVLTND